MLQGSQQARPTGGCQLVQPIPALQLAHHADTAQDTAYQVLVAPRQCVMLRPPHVACCILQVPVVRSEHAVTLVADVSYANKADGSRKHRAADHVQVTTAAPRQHQFVSNSI
jgi:hypothetical protein